MQLNHLAIIMDGNRRWAKKHNLPAIAGHHQGAKNLEKIAELAQKKGIQILTVYAFSTENWKRTKNEVAGLLRLLKYFMSKRKEKLNKLGVSLSIIGDLSKFPKNLQKEINKTVNYLKNNKKLHLNIALNYGGRAEIIHAFKEIKKKKIKNITENIVSNNLYTQSQPDPDIIIRTGGELRLSNFLTWQSTYSELYFTKTLWPNFNARELNKVTQEFNRRQRRYGQ